MQTNRLKVFETVKTNLESVGFIREKGRFHTEQWLHTAQGFLANILLCLYLLFDADTVKEYMDSIFMSACGILVYVAYLNMVLNTEIFFNNIDEIENLANESKFKLQNLFLSILSLYHTR